MSGERAGLGMQKSGLKRAMRIPMNIGFLLQNHLVPMLLKHLLFPRMLAIDRPLNTNNKYKCYMMLRCFMAKVEVVRTQ